MIRDANAAVPALEGRFDCCIAGAGPAGITLALKLSAAGQRVVLLEAGDREFTSESQDLYDGVVLGQYYDPLDVSRLRYFGGTSGHWGGQLLLFDRFDFESREDVPLSGWPIGYDDLAPYQEAAADMADVMPFRGERWASGLDPNLEVVAQRWSTDRRFYELRNITPMHFGARYLDAVAADPRIELVLNANIVGLSVDGGSGRVTGAEVQNYAGGAFRVSADTYVLAMGGLENCRALLHLNRQQGDRFGNQGGMAGRCFMEHPVMHNGAYFITRRLYSNSRYWEFERLIRNQKPELALSPSGEFTRARGILNSTIRMDRFHRRPLSEREIAGAPFVRDLEFDQDYFFVGPVWTVSEQAPNPASRVVLTEDRDRFGLHKVGLDWRLLPIDAETQRVATLEVARMMIRTGLGRMQVDPNLWEEGKSDLAYDISRHHMGGARMSRTAETGVVDADCRVHGAENLYVAGSAVFATSGHANPTFTILQLALRLADHLAAKTA